MGDNSVLGSTPMDSASKHNATGQRKERSGNLLVALGRWEISRSNGNLWDTSFLFDEGGYFDEDRSCDVENVLTGDEVKCSGAKHGAGEVHHEGTCSWRSQ